ncbi:YggS family pyridoxal phosphate-dependent enzyme [Thermosynechococcus sp. B0]|uniref:YggS family pyridoxal phosphate-dependent enzyme n=1 Tax=unclassified Thermosynechococcus TaxID=2622553 RepID=UPI00122E8DF1|nr:MULTISPECIES: YggS family pyridoxal phosphate-dependent enzyme [unclassified Thermosynechococcus]QEQ01925.1 YggS family pyridoxal phosphate-dependent enzyme [Thermosynechococcus sp. CL-1]WJI25416.1 YggS family pyridoxal phosphate-dependent enzyme [Thermosynechococcus sp. B0]WJI27947.1 YggS family pyridoxal phosphate-dependent enzyme [Thermosynechococcus sp. B1]WJI30475.1 YggS family pyridoxal phosphate-dependent enzyme [Thermosynechococcus sp. B3]
MLSAAEIRDRATHLKSTLPPHVRLIAVSKFMPAAAIRAAYEAGIRDFGESRVQEAASKRTELADLTDITWHLIGHLQTNKVRQALQLFDWIHTVDRWKLAERINAILRETDAPSPHCLLQVKLRPDPQKHGWERSELEAALPQLDALSHLRCCGLMTILPLGLPPAEQLQVFQELRAWGEELRTKPWQQLQWQEYSMGMTQDYPLAVQAGATMVRIGTAIFGDRQATLEIHHE